MAREDQVRELERMEDALESVKRRKKVLVGEASACWRRALSHINANDEQRLTEIDTSKARDELDALDEYRRQMISLRNEASELEGQIRRQRAKVSA